MNTQPTLAVRTALLSPPFAVLVLVTVPSAFAQESDGESRPITRPMSPDPGGRSGAAFASDELLLRFRDALDPLHPLAVQLLSSYGLEPVAFNPWIAVHRIQLAPGTTVAELVRDLRRNPLVEFVEPNRYRQASLIPNDPFYQNAPFPTDQQRWIFDGIGADRNLDAHRAWDLTTGRSDVVIAVIDSGVDLDHPDLVDNLWVHPGEIPANGIDDDGNGFIDDLNGYDFQAGDADPNPDLGDGIDNDGIDGPDSNVFHGTFVASVLGARGNNGLGLAGAAWSCQIMALKVFTDDGGASDFDIASAITYAANEGAQIINLSLGGPGFSRTLALAVDFAWTSGLTQVAAAGNDDAPDPRFPASLPHVVSVGGTDSGSLVNLGSGDLDGRAPGSQFGLEAVDVVAPGADVLGASVGSVAEGIPGIPFFTIASGTSFAAPLVSGLAALMISRARDQQIALSNDSIEAMLVSTATDLPDDPDDSPDGGPDWDGRGRVGYRDSLDAVDALPGNSAPVADAGPDQTGQVFEELTFDGSGSFDPDPDSLDFAWDFGDGSPLQFTEQAVHAYSAPGVYLVTLTVSDGLQVDRDTAVVTIEEAPPSSPVIRFSSKMGRRISRKKRAANEDILALSLDSGEIAILFDGSDVGLGKTALDGFVFLPDGDLLMTLSRPLRLEGILDGPGGSTRVEDEDIVRFTPTLLGETTAGVFTFHFDGSDVGLTGPGEDIDALGLFEGDLLLSTRGRVKVPGLGDAGDEDILRFSAQSLGSSTAGTFGLFFDGSDVELSAPGEDVDALSVSGSTGDFFFSTAGFFNARGVKARDGDVLRFGALSLGETTAGSFEVFRAGSDLVAGPLRDLSGLDVVE